MILLFGASGYIGTHFLKSFRPSECLGTYCGTAVDGAVRFDVRTTTLNEILSDSQTPSHAVIMLGITRIDPCKTDEAQARAINVAGIKRLVDELFARGIKPVFTSSDFVFDGRKGHYKETDAPCPNTFYGTQKVEVEEFLRASHKDYLILRLPKTFGTEPGDQTLLTNWIGPLQRGETIPCAADQKFCATHVSDIVAGIRKSLEMNLSGTYHLCASMAYTRVQLVRMLADSLAVSPKIRECSILDLGFPDTRPIDISMNSEKFCSETRLTFRSMPDCCQDIAAAVLNAR
jgi:dTDP-4-dehydrorhamnose reductase